MKHPNPKSASKTVINSVNSNFFLIFILLGVLIACYTVIRPYIHPIIIAAILASLLSPLHKRIERLLKGEKNMAASLSCLFLTIVVVLPMIVMLLSVIQEGIQSFKAISVWVQTVKIEDLIQHPVVIQLIDWVNRVMPDVKKVFPDIDLKHIQLDKLLLTLTSSTGKMLVNQGGNLAGNVTAMIGKFFLMLFCFFFFIRDEKKIVEYILHLIPLSSDQEAKIIFKIKNVAKSALLGTFVTAFAQGTAGGLAFWIAGLPGLFWGMVMAFASLIPMVGTALIWIPAAVFLFITGHWGYGLFMIIWCVIVVGGLDNLVRPLFMQGGADMSTLLIFFAILGGIHTFGLLGLLYGPLLFGLAMVLLYIYEIEYKDFLDGQDNTRITS
ncbi:MAG: AI-2E family transporter [Desulfobacteraceae bacterium]|nr:MAG: AI-2E family transporter [Desulfobacteraceae bacterium]